MANFTKLENQYYLSSDRAWYLVDGPLTENDVKIINSLNTKITLILKNTKGQNSDIIKKFSHHNIQFSVIGGLDYLKKQKFKDRNYVGRTIHTPVSLSKVIEYFEKIEKNIRYTWTDTQKCMYVYKTLTENLHYKYQNESSYENGKDVVRRLDGVLYGKLVCSGFALVFKETMDRLNIPCIYQNKRSHHSWNIVKLGGKFRGIELTWDCSCKGKDNKCEFFYFGRDNNFYQNEHHNLSSETEEQTYNLEPFRDIEIIENYKAIKIHTNVIKKKMNCLLDDLGNRIYYLSTENTGSIKSYIVSINDIIYNVYTNQDVKHALTKRNVEYACTYSNGLIGVEIASNNIKKYKTFKRRDLSTFKLRKTTTTKDNMHEFYYLDIVKEPDGIYYRKAVLLSETDLTLNWNDKINNIIANELLSKTRVNRKIEHYNGYVGYIGNNGDVYYNNNFEENNLNIHKRR